MKDAIIILAPLKRLAKKFYKNCKKIPSMIRSKHYRLRREKVDIDRVAWKTGNYAPRMPSTRSNTRDRILLDPCSYTHQSG